MEFKYCIVGNILYGKIEDDNIIDDIVPLDNDNDEIELKNLPKEENKQ